VLYLSHTPRSPLSNFVERIWLAIDGQSSRQERILPSGTIELVINLHDDQVRIDRTAGSSRARAFSGVVVSGPYSGVFIIDGRQHAAMMGVHFRPGGAPPVLGAPSGEFTDAHVDLAALWGDAVTRELRERLLASATHRERFQILEDVLTRRLRSTVRQHPLVPFALEQFRPTGLGASVGDVARRAGVSHRRFLTVFTAEVGLTPKVFCRILRFRHLHAVAQRTGHIDWAQLALACGYFDQAHLSNELRKLSGLRPTEYQRHIQQTIDLLPGHIAIP
jgi:AraC-like DNA-binding protein